VTIQTYLDYVDAQNKHGIAKFLYQRLYSRYLKPFSFKNEKYKIEYKNGFAIMANSCLLIETLQSFKNGWGDSDRKSGQAFKQFFLIDENFSELKTKGQSFYEHIRCGILHQGETTGGWKITRIGTKLFDEKNLVINAKTFANRLEKSLKDYAEELKSEKWDSELWDNFRTRMRKIISHSCK
jgi:hypothetical protein